jgi:hypothetical protein
VAHGSHAVAALLCGKVVAHGVDASGWFRSSAGLMPKRQRC